ITALLRWVAFVGKILGILHHLHDVDAPRSTRNHAISGRAGTERHHAGHGDRGRNNGRGKNNGDLAHLALLSGDVEREYGDGQAWKNCRRSSSCEVMMRPSPMFCCALGHTFDLACEIFQGASIPPRKRAGADCEGALRKATHSGWALGPTMMK